MTVNVALKRFVIASVTKTKLCVNLVLVLNCLIFIHSVFFRYRCLSSKLDLSSPSLGENVRRILSIIDRLDPESYQFGRSKVSLCTRYAYYAG